MESGRRMEIGMLLVVLGLAAWGILRDCHIPIGGGFGWDGSYYGLVALEPEAIFRLTFNRVQRCLPSLLVHLVMHAAGLPRSPATVIALFTALNLTVILASLFLWLRIVSELRFRMAAAVFGFCGLFLSFALATMPYYYPVLTDTTAMFLGLLSVWLYLTGRSWWLLGVAFISGFVWPSLMYFLAPLIVFRVKEGAVEPTRRRWAMPLSAAGAILVMLGAAWALPTNHPIAPVLPLSFVLLGVYAFWGSLKLLDAGAGIPRGSFGFERLRGPAVRAAAVVALYVAHYVCLSTYFTIPTEYWQTPKGLLTFILKTGVIAPGSPMVGHTAYLGILFLVVVGLWGRICRAAAELGPGAWCFLAICFAFSLNAESRHSNAHWPMVVVLACRVLDEFDWSFAPVATFCGLSALNSRAWVDLNFNFPELFFANFIVNMSPFWYLVQALAFIVIAAYLQLSWALAGFGRRTDPPASGQTGL